MKKVVVWSVIGVIILSVLIGSITSQAVSNPQNSDVVSKGGASFSIDWWDGAWRYRRFLTLDIGTHDDEAFRGIEINGITFTTSPMNEFRLINSNGEEKAFTIVDFNDTWASLMITVQQGETDFYLYYDNPLATMPIYYGDGGKYGGDYTINNDFDGELQQGVLEDGAFFQDNTFGEGVASLVLSETQGWVNYGGPKIDSGSWTIDTWAYLADSSSWDTLFFQGQGTGNNAVNAVFTRNGITNTWEFRVFTTEWLFVKWNNIPPLEENKWYHIAYTTNCVIYIDGQPYQPTTGSCVSVAGNNHPFFTSQSDNSPWPNIQKWDGYLSNFRVHSGLSTSFACMTGIPCSVIAGDEEANGPDLAVTSVTYSPEVPRLGEEVAVTVTVENTGGEVINGFDWIYDFEYGVPGSESIESGFNTGDTLNITLQHTYTGIAGDYTFYFEVDPNNDIIESDETNNVALHNIFIDGNSDLVPIFVNYVQDDINPNFVIFNLGIKNQGNLAVSNVMYDFDFGDSTGSGELITDEIIPGATKFFSVDHNYVSLNNYNIQYTIDPSDTITELDENNNVFNKRIILNRLGYTSSRIGGNCTVISGAVSCS